MDDVGFVKPVDIVVFECALVKVVSHVREDLAVDDCYLTVNQVLANAHGDVVWVQVVALSFRI